jgi:hypothetical protein
MLALACTSSDPGERYLRSSAFRRETLVASLVNPTNGYAQLRLAHYESGGPDDWARLKVINPKVAPLGLDGEARALELDAADLGEQAFFRFPVQDLPDVALASPAQLAAQGFWRDARRGLGGLVRVTYDSGLTGVSTTCATCHARPGPNGLEVGLPNGALNRGWGRGLLDVTLGTGEEAVAISDLRPVRDLTHLHHSANVKQLNIAALAIRIETLIITSHAKSARRC